MCAGVLSHFFERKLAISASRGPFSILHDCAMYFFDTEIFCELNMTYCIIKSFKFYQKVKACVLIKRKLITDYGDFNKVKISSSLISRDGDLS